MNIEKFNSLQHKLVDNFIKERNDKIREIITLIIDVISSLRKILTLLNKLNNDNIFSKKIRYTYYVLIKDVFYLFKKNTDKMHNNNISIYIKEGMLKYREIKLTDIVLPFLVILKEKNKYCIKIDNETFEIKSKINAYLDIEKEQHTTILKSKDIINKAICTLDSVISILNKIIA